MFVSRQAYKNNKISIFAPEFSFIGHSITNLAKFQTSYLKSTHSLKSDDKVSDNADYEDGINYYHLGNSPHNLEVLNNFIKTRKKRNILILHDTNLTDLVRYAVSKNGLKSVKELFKNQSPKFVKKVLQDTHTLDTTEKCSFFVDSLFKMDLPSTRIVIHNSQYLRIAEKNLDGKLSQKELPIGYHFMEQKITNQTQVLPLIVVGGSHRDEQFSFAMKNLLSDLGSKKRFQVIFLGGIAKHSLETLNDVPNVYILENVSNENWQIILSRAHISIRIAVGRNGESSGFLRDSLLRAKYVLGDEDSQVLKKFSNYMLLEQEVDIQKMHQTLEHLLSDDYSRNINYLPEKNSYIEKNSLTEYFEFLDKLALNL